MKSLYFYWLCLTLVLLSFAYAVFNSSPPIPRDLIVPVVEADSVPDSVPPDVEAQVIPKPKTNEGNNNISKVDTHDSVSVLPTKATPRITQTEIEHVKKGNGSVYATDIVYPTEDVPFPDTYGDYVIYYIGKDERIGDYIIIRHGQDRWLFGHTVTSRSGGEYVDKTNEGKVLGQSNISGVATARHTHIERWRCPDIGSKMKDCSNVSSTGQVAERNQAIIEQRGWVGDGGGRKESDNLRNKEMAERREGKEVGGKCTSDAAQEEVNYAYQLGGIDFVGTIAAESKFDPASVGDHGKSFGYCQIHDTWNKATQMEYRKLTTNKERLDFCYKIYKGYLDKGNIHNRLYGYNVRFTKGLPKLNIKCDS